ncbi:hypothetical protein QF035_004951 [Streptomyces umbrinus]|uniref:Uncharacterized protein n=1 Tax=Streptomyces umbrinus TaxID=67370 RepID=A0ABU0SY04_9ACTN|nr:hypothetical protein [Streptomyces umbrinus]
MDWAGPVSALIGGGIAVVPGWTVERGRWKREERRYEPDRRTTATDGDAEFERVRHAFNDTRQELRDRMRADLDSLRQALAQGPTEPSPSPDLVIRSSRSTKSCPGFGMPTG